MGVIGQLQQSRAGDLAVRGQLRSERFTTFAKDRLAQADIVGPWIARPERRWLVVDNVGGEGIRHHDGLDCVLRGYSIGAAKRRTKAMLKKSVLDFFNAAESGTCPDSAHTDQSLA